MNILTDDIISVIVTRNFPIIKHMFYRHYTIVYIDDDGNLHRINGPAIIWDDNEWRWYFHGKKHRDQINPASFKFGYYDWYNMGKLVAECKK